MDILGGLLGNLDDPQRQAMLKMAAGLLAPVRQKGGKGFLEALGNGLQGGVQGFNVGAETQRRNQGADMSNRMAQMQFDQAQKGQQFDQAVAAGYKPAQNMNPTPNDDQGFALPPAMSQPGFDFSGAAKIDPMRAMQLQQQMQPKPEMRTFTPGQRLVEMGPNGPIERYAAPDKPKHEPGDTREIKAGRTIVTQTWNGKSWDNSYKSAMDAPDKPDKQERAPQGYRWDGDKLAAIAGGPADPNVGKKQAVPTEDERRSAGLAVRMESAVKAMRQFPNARGPEMIPETIRTMTGGVAEAPANLMTSGSRQQVEAAQLDALDAALTLATGAAYTKDQLQNLRKSYFPQLGDAPATAKAKEKKLEEIIQTARIRAGRAQGDIDQVLGGQKSGGGQAPTVDDLVKKYLR